MIDLRERDMAILRKIIAEIDYLDRLVCGLGLGCFLESEETKRAAAMTAIIIGELAKHLSSEFCEEHPGSNLKYAKKTRDVYAHGYFSLSFETVYRTAVEDYPSLREELVSLLENADAAGSE